MDEIPIPVDNEGIVSNKKNVDQSIDSNEQNLFDTQYRLEKRLNRFGKQFMDVIQTQDTVDINLNYLKQIVLKNDNQLSLIISMLRKMEQNIVNTVNIRNTRTVIPFNESAKCSCDQLDCQLKPKAYPNHLEQYLIDGMKRNNYKSNCEKSSNSYGMKTNLPSYELNQIWPITSIYPMFVLCFDGYITIKKFSYPLKVNANYEQYKFGYGNIAQEYWLGLQKIHELTNQVKMKLIVEITFDEQQNIGNKLCNLNVDSFMVGSELEQYRLKVFGKQEYTQLNGIFLFHDPCKDISACLDNWDANWWEESCFTNPFIKMVVFKIK